MAFHGHLLGFCPLVSHMWPSVPDLPRFAQKCFINYMIFYKKDVSMALRIGLGLFWNRIGIRVAFPWHFLLCFPFVSHFWPGFRELCPISVIIS